MSHQQIIAETSQLLAELPEEQAAEVLDFAAFLRQRQQARLAAAADELLRQQIQQQVETSEAFAFLHDEAEDVYTLADVKFHYAAPPADAAE